MLGKVLSIGYVLLLAIGIQVATATGFMFKLSEIGEEALESAAISASIVEWVIYVIFALGVSGMWQVYLIPVSSIRGNYVDDNMVAAQIFHAITGIIVSLIFWTWYVIPGLLFMVFTWFTWWKRFEGKKN